jgi:hypothetical protein
VLEQLNARAEAFILGLIAAALPFAAGAQMEMPSRTLEGFAPRVVAFRAPGVPVADTVPLAAPLEKRGLSGVDANGRVIAGPVRPVPKAAHPLAWTPVAGGFVARFRVASEEALGLRVKLEFGVVPGEFDLRVQGSAGRMEAMTLDPRQGSEAWTPWTEGSQQVIELFSPVLPSPGAVSVGAVLHFAASPLEKAGGSCLVSTKCSTNDAALDAAIAEVKKSVSKITFIDNSWGYFCSGTLINSDKFPAPFFLTANHCLDSGDVAGTVNNFWFFETVGCDDLTTNSGFVQTMGGAQVVFTNYNVDLTLLQLEGLPPAGAVYSSWSGAPLGLGAPIVSISHPGGETARLALGSVESLYHTDGWPQEMYAIRYSRGIIESGSSGSGLFVLNNGKLQLRGTLYGTSVFHQASGMSCTNLDEVGVYARFEIILPQIQGYISAARSADDAPNRIQDFTAASDPPVLLGTSTVEINGRRIDYAGDLDLVRFTLAQAAYVSAWTEGTPQTVGLFMASDGTNLQTNDDAEFATASRFNAGITRKLGPGTYYYQVGHFDAAGTGTYNVRLRADRVDTNYTDLWWNQNESGWGVNVNHQGDILFATLFTYGPDGKGAWYSMSEGRKQPDGSYLGDLFRTTGPAFNAAPFTPLTAANFTTVGTMRFTFTGANTGVLTYNVGSAAVTKDIARISIGAPPTCNWSAFDRSMTNNYQDLWWNRKESGWGVNVTHQGNTLFATLFTYDAAGQPMWLVMSNGAMTAPGNYGGLLHRTTGPAFNALPFTPIGPGNYTEVGTMSFSFTGGNAATMTYTVNGATVVKHIERLEFGTVKTQCST